MVSLVVVPDPEALLGGWGGGLEKSWTQLNLIEPSSPHHFKEVQFNNLVTKLQDVQLR